MTPALRELESEAIFVLREVAAEFERPAILFSGGKDSLLLVHLARRAFAPARIPFDVLHVDTGHNFPETLAFRDRLVAELGLRMKVALVEDSIRRGTAAEEPGAASRNRLQSVTLLEAIQAGGYHALVGGARRDEEKARAKERFFSLRSSFGEWDPKRQRPEWGRLFNLHRFPGETFRVFPLNNWTELDVWAYVRAREIELPSLYFAHLRRVFPREGTLYASGPYTGPRTEGEHAGEAELRVRFRTIGDMTCTGGLVSEAASADEVIEELGGLRTTERGTRMDDRFSETAMEDRKRQGYF